MPLAFEQQPRESDKAFAAFSLYLSMGPNRSTREVGKRLGKSEGLIERWAAKFDWRSRVQAYAAHLATIEREAIEGLALEKAIEWGKVHEALKVAEWQRHKKLIALADEMIARWEANPEKCGTLEGIARVLELATRLGRLAAGLPTEVKEVSATMKATIDVDWEIAIRKAYGVTEDAEKLKPETLKGEVVDVESTIPELPSPGAVAPPSPAPASEGQTEVKG